ncbi:MAG: hypothetical protein H6Q73_2225 [Firmicutes bacterium]|nr:hypothetical protein [Bacillota bacterium]
MSCNVLIALAGNKEAQKDNPLFIQVLVVFFLSFVLLGSLL